MVVEIIGDASKLNRTLREAEHSTRGFGASLGQLSIGFGQLVKGVIIVDAVQKAIEGLTASVHLGVAEFSENQKVTAQTLAVLKSTGGVANVTAKQIDAMGLSLSNLSGIDDELVRAGENVLLSFTNIRDFAGRGNQVFTEATKAVVDFAARTGRDVPAAALILGRALEDPARRVASLSRAGIVFSAAQQKVLKQVENTQGVLAAQKLLLQEIERRYKGAAEAAGKTLSGQLNVLRDRFKDLAGSGIGLIAPATARAVTGLTEFVRRLSEATTARAKLTVVFTGLENLGRNLYETIKGQIDRVDFDALGTVVRERLGRVNWAAAVGSAGRAVGDALVAALDGLRTALERVNWQAVGKTIVDGVSIAIAAVAKFLISVDWKKVTVAVARTFAAALDASWGIVVGAGEELGRRVVGAVQSGVTKAGSVLKATAIKIAIAIIEPFTHIPTRIFGVGFANFAQKAKKALEAMLADQQTTGASGGAKVGGAIADGIAAGFANRFQVAKQSIGATAAEQFAATVPTLPAPPPPPRRKGITASQRYTFFDNALTRMLDRVQDIPTLKDQLARLKEIAGVITARLAVTKDITRRLTLEDDLVNVLRQEKQARTQISQGLLDALQLKVDKAAATTGLRDDLTALKALQQGIRQRIASEGATVDLQGQLLNVQQQITAKRVEMGTAVVDALNLRVDKAAATAGLRDDLAALTALQAGIKARIKEEGRTLELQRDLFNVQQQIAQTRAAARAAPQFKALGLTATGEDVIPGIRLLKRQLGRVDEAISGTFLDTKKTRSVIAHIREVLAGGLGAVGRDVRDKVHGILSDLDNQLKAHEGDKTKFQHISSEKFLESLGLTGLSRADLQRLRTGFAQVGAGGTVPSRGPAFALAGTTGLSFHGPVTNHFHGVQNLRDMEDQLEKRARSRAYRRRGA